MGLSTFGSAELGWQLDDETLTGAFRDQRSHACPLRVSLLP